MYYMGCRCPMGRELLGVSGRLKSIAKHRTLGVGGKVSCPKNGGSILTMYMLYDVFFTVARPNKSSAIAEMGDHARAKWAENWGRLLCPFPWGS